MDRPHARELVAVARETFVRELLPALDGGNRYTGLMIANALAIALRELEGGADAERDARQRLRSIYAANADEDDVSLERRLAHDLRSGAFDGDDRRARDVRAYLEASTRARVAIANPKVLE